MSFSLKPVVRITKTGLKIISKNSNLILTFVSAAGVIATTVVAVKGTIKAVKLYEEVKPVGTKEIVKTVWKCFIPTIGMVIITTTAILCNGKINAKRLAIMASAYTSSVESAKRIEEKFTESLGPKKAAAVIDDIHSQKAEDNKPKSEKDIIATGNGDELFFIEDVGQWIYSDTNRIELAELKTQNDMADGNDWDDNGDTILLMNTPLERLGARTCDTGRRLVWRAEELKKLGLKGPKFRVSSRRMDVCGQNRAVGTIWFEPEPREI